MPKPTEMNTKEFAEFISKLTGHRKSVDSISQDCRDGLLESYREDGGHWKIIVRMPTVPIEEYTELENKYKKAQQKLIRIRQAVQEEAESN